MKRSTAFSFSALAIALTMAIPITATAENGPDQTPTQYRIGVVNLKSVFDAYEKQKDQYAALEKERDERQIVIDQLSDKITRAKERYDAQRDTMSPDERAALEDSIESDYGLYQAEFKRLQQEIDRREKKILEDIFDDIREAVRTVGAQQNYHLILEAGESGRSGVLYSSSTLNMTSRVIDYLNATYKTN